ncbi:hypothetical protein LCGC14_2795510, partial [marine sediment metagenome]
ILGAGALEAEAVPREQIKKHVIEPIVPDFDFGDLQIAPKPPRFVQEAVFEIAGIPEEDRPALRQAVEEAKPLSIPITSDVVEEVASWVLDPINLVFIAGPALKAAGGAARLANQIRKTKNIPNFIRAAMRVATEETATGAARPWILALRVERDSTRSTIEAMRSAGGRDDLIREAESWLGQIEGKLAQAEGRGIVGLTVADVGAEALVPPTAEELAGLAAMRTAALAPDTADVGAARAAILEAPLGADVRVGQGVTDLGTRPGVDVPPVEGLVSSQVLEPRPVGGPAILSTRLPNVRTPLDDIMAKLSGEAGGAQLSGDVSKAGLQAERSIRQELGIVETIGDESWIFADGAIVDISEGSRKLPTARIDGVRGLLGERYGGYFHTDVSIRYLPPEDRAAFYRELDDLAESP